MNRIPQLYKLGFILPLLAIALAVGCSRGPAEIEAEAERNFARLRPLIREAETIEKQIVTDAAAAAAKSSQNLEAIRSLRAKLAKLGGETPPPQPQPQPAPPNPSPTPAPKPPGLPDGQFAIANDVLQWVNTLVPAESRASGLQHFIAGAEAIANDCDNGTITGLTRYTLVMAIKDAIGKHNASIPPDVLLSWKAFAAAFNARANTLFSAGRLTTPKEWATLLREVVIGLRAAK